MPPSCRDAALAVDVEMQMAQCAAIAANRKAGRHLWRILFQAAGGAVGAVWQPHRRFEIERLMGVLR
jgi:hypothetical protein